MHLAGGGTLLWGWTHDVNDDIVVHFLKNNKRLKYAELTPVASFAYILSRIKA
jgi:hypothetical protein